jgi:hypothetical protein
LGELERFVVQSTTRWLPKKGTAKTMFRLGKIMKAAKTRSITTFGGSSGGKRLKAGQSWQKITTNGGAQQNLAILWRLQTYIFPRALVAGQSSRRVTSGRLIARYQHNPGTRPRRIPVVTIGTDVSLTIAGHGPSRGGSPSSNFSIATVVSN